MTNRFPLIVDTSDSNKIKELPSGDNLNLSGNSIIGASNITASGTLTVENLVTQNLTTGGDNLADVATSGLYSDLTGSPSNVSTFVNDANYVSNTDPVSTFTNDAGYLTSVAFSEVTSKPTTLSGYGITDAGTSAQGILADSSAQPGANISIFNNDSGYITLAQVQNGELTVDVNNSGDLQGSVFGSDSTVLVDGILSAINLDGTVRGDVVPNVNQHDTWDLGTNAVRFKDAYFAGNVIGTIVAATATPPTANSDPGSTGEIRYDDNYLYIKTASGWKRTALSGIV